MDSIKDLEVGGVAEVMGFHTGDEKMLPYRKKLLSMGFTPGVNFTLKKVAPLGDPVEIALRGFSLSLRKAEAAVLKIRRHHENRDCR